MAGRLPGVAVLSRRRSEEHHHLHLHHLHPHPTINNSSLNLQEHPPYLSHAHSAMDETALKARQRLHNKLEHLYSSLRSSNYNNNGGNEEGGKVVKEKQSNYKWCKSWLWLVISRYKKERRVVCCVCLEDLLEKQEEEEKEEVMRLSCSHKYHSACLLPWLQSHPHCPYCRTPVHISS